MMPMDCAQIHRGNYALLDIPPNAQMRTSTQASVLIRMLDIPLNT